MFFRIGAFNSPNASLTSKLPPEGTTSVGSVKATKALFCRLALGLKRLVSRRYSPPKLNWIGPPGRLKKAPKSPLTERLATDWVIRAVLLSFTWKKPSACWLIGPGPNRLTGTQPGLPPVRFERHTGCPLAPVTTSSACA